MSDILEKIGLYKRDEIAAAKAQTSLSQLLEQISEQTPTRGFKQALETARSKGKIGLIAEIKKASPSKGIIRAEFSPPILAKCYENGGANCLSVLTDTPSFQGHPDFLKQARHAVDLPVLRKDFMYDTYQVFEARAWGADAILIILSAVDNNTALELRDAAVSLNMDVLCEIHDAEELNRAIDLKMDMIGINNRNLRSFKTTLQTSFDLIPHIPDGTCIISESGIFTHEDAQSLAQHGAHALLVGESLMRQPDVTAATKLLLNGK